MILLVPGLRFERKLIASKATVLPLDDPGINEALDAPQIYLSITNFHYRQFHIYLRERGTFHIIQGLK